MSGNNAAQKNYDINMTEGPLMTGIIAFFVPLMISNILQLLFNAVDLVVVGQFAGHEALAAVGATTSLIAVLTTMMIGISMGANVMAARYIAVKNRKDTHDAVHTAILMALIMGVFLLLVGLFFSRFFLRLMNTPDNILGSSTLYMRIYFCGMPFFAIYNYGAAILRASGDTRRPLYYLVFSGILNACLNMLLVIVFHLDVAGVALATIFSQMISCILVVRCMMTMEGICRLRLRDLHINISIMKKMLAVGIPAGVQSTVINFSNVLLQSSVNSFGDVAMAGYTAANNILGFLYFSVNSVTQAGMSFTSQNYAMKRRDRINAIIRDCVFIECLLCISMGSFVFVFAPRLLGIYTDSAEVVASGIEVLKYTTTTYFLCGIMDCIPGIMRGMGHSTVPMILSITGTVGTRMVWIFGLFPIYRSISFLFISYPVSWILTVIMQGICLMIVLKHDRSI